MEYNRSEYTQQLEALVAVLERQAQALPDSARQVATQLLNNVENAIESATNSDLLSNLPKLVVENGQPTATITNDREAEAESTFRRQFTDDLFAGFNNDTAKVLAEAMREVGLWQKSWQTAYENAGTHNSQAHSEDRHHHAFGRERTPPQTTLQPTEIRRQEPTQQGQQMLLNN